MFDPGLYMLNEGNPWKRPDGRKRRCEYLIQHHYCPGRTDDPITWEAWRFFEALNKCHTDAERDRVFEYYPALAEAQHVVNVSNTLRRAELEARLLANEPYATISAKMGLTLEGISSFHDLYFNVRPYLHADSYITSVVLGPKVHHGSHPDDHPLFLKMFGYALGGLAVDEYLDYIHSPPVLPADLLALDTDSLKRLNRRFKIKVAVLMYTTPAGAGSQATWLELGGLAFGKNRGNVDDMQGGIKAAATILECLQKMNQTKETESLCESRAVSA